MVTYAKKQYWNGDRQQLGIVLLAVWFLSICGGILLGSIVLAPLTLFMNVGGIITLFGISIGTIATGWVGYRARAEVKQRIHVQKLAETPSPENAAAAVPLVESRDEYVRGEAVYTIATAAERGPGAILKHYHGDTAEIVNNLATAIEADDATVRSNATRAIALFSRDFPAAVKQHRPLLTDALGDSDSHVQIQATIALVNLAYAYPDDIEEMTDAIIPLLDDSDPAVRANTCESLGNLREVDERIPGLLEEMEGDPNPRVTEAAKRARGTHQSESESQPHAAKESTEEQAPTFLQSPPDHDLADVAGMDSLKEQLQESIIDPFHGSEVYAKYGVSPDSSILFHGPPGTGKTYLATCLAGELDVNYISVDTSDIESKWLGEGVENIKQVFEEARENQPCLVFIDEIDALAGDRSSSQQHDDKKKMVNQLLQELSAVDDSDDLLVIAATNNPDQIDSAILRTGRFDSKIHIPKPDDEARVSIFRHHLDAPTEDLDWDEFTRATRGFVASDMVAVGRRAALSAAKRERETGQEGVVTHADVMEAVDEISVERGSTGEFVQRPPDSDFSDVAGMDELKKELRSRIIAPLENPTVHEQYGLSVENGILLYGPPGTGKTHMARCLAGELDINYIEAKAGDLVSQWVGKGTKNVQSMFDEARENQPCLLFIDEIDALTTDRGAGTQQTSERQMVNQFLEEMSQLSTENEDVIVIGATNRIGDIDSAMLRTGRFTEKIEVPPPDAEARSAIFEMHLTAPDDGIDLSEVATLTDGFVASDMETVADRAARKAMHRADGETDVEPVTEQDVKKAVRDIRQPAG